MLYPRLWGEIDVNKRELFENVYYKPGNLKYLEFHIREFTKTVDSIDATN